MALNRKHPLPLVFALEFYPCLGIGFNFISFNVKKRRKKERKSILIERTTLDNANCDACERICVEFSASQSTNGLAIDLNQVNDIDVWDYFPHLVSQYIGLDSLGPLRIRHFINLIGGMLYRYLFLTHETNQIGSHQCRISTI